MHGGHVDVDAGLVCPVPAGPHVTVGGVAGAGWVCHGAAVLAQGFGSADVAAAPDPLIEALRLSARRPGNARTVVSLMHAIDRFRRPRPESVLTSAELAAITTPTIFILGSGDPYLSVERARTSIDQIHGARLYEVPGGHTPWLAGAQHAAELIVTHSHLATAPHLTPAPDQSRQANAPA